MPVRLPGQGQPGQDQRAACLRGRGRRLPDHRLARAPGLLLLGIGPAGGGDAGRLEAEPVRQPAEPGVALPVDRPGDLGADRRADHPLRGRHRHRRHDLRHRPLPQGGLRRPGAGHRRRPGGLGLLRRHRPALPGRGRRRGHLAADLRQGHLRPGHRGQRRGVVPDDPAAGPRGGAAHRRLVRHGRGGRAAGRPVGRPRRRDRRAAARRRPGLPGQDLQRRVDGRLRVPVRGDGRAPGGRRGRAQGRLAAAVRARAPGRRRPDGHREPARVRRLPAAGAQRRAAGDGGRGRRLDRRAGPAGRAGDRPGPPAGRGGRA